MDAVTAVTHIWGGDRVRLPSGKTGKVVRWRTQCNADIQRPDERVAIVAYDDGGTADLSERLMRRAVKLESTEA